MQRESSGCTAVAALVTSDGRVLVVRTTLIFVHRASA